jgi:hypothetical protein
MMAFVRVVDTQGLGPAFRPATYALMGKGKSAWTQGVNREKRPSTGQAEPTCTEHVKVTH